MDFCVWIICSRPIIIMHAPWVMEFTILPDHPMVIIFSSPELKAQMGFSDRGSSVVLPSVNIFIFSRTTEPILTKLGTMDLWVKEIQVCSNEEPFNSHMIDNGFFLLLISVKIQSYLLTILIWTVFSSDRCGPWVSC